MAGAMLQLGTLSIAPQPRRRTESLQFLARAGVKGPRQQPGPQILLIRHPCRNGAPAQKGPLRPLGPQRLRLSQGDDRQSLSSATALQLFGWRWRCKSLRHFKLATCRLFISFEVLPSFFRVVAASRSAQTGSLRSLFARVNTKGGGAPVCGSSQFFHMPSRRAWTESR